MSASSEPGGQAHAWRWLYPPVACHASGWLPVGGGHQIHWETCGHPLGQPALFLHGGPGAGCTPQDRRWFDPARYRIVLFDQRGCGRSRPLGRLADNGRPELIADIEALRHHLQIDRWLLFGGSWGATLALAYAQAHPAHVHALVLRGVYTATPSEQRWLYGPDGAARLQPQDWQRFIATVPPEQRGDLLAGYQRQLDSEDPLAGQAATQAWLGWEQALMAHEDPAAHASGPAFDDTRRAMARIGVHFARQPGLLDPHRAPLAPLPGVIVQGEQDRITPPAAALALHRAWPRSRLQRLPGAGHASSHPEMARALVAATDGFAAPPPISSLLSSHNHKETVDERASPIPE